jgi:ABC-type branched-subunit amino acid transport system ATPase component/ABC-type branched-subunit amino acid transport system permease subunit
MAYAQAIFTNAGIYIIATMGLAIFTGYTGLFSLGHAAFMAIGGYTAAILTYFFHIPLVPALAAGVTLSVLVSLIIGYPTLRVRLRSDYFAIATLGFGEAVKVLLENLPLTQGARGLPGITKLADPFNTFLFVILTVWLCQNFLKSNYGRKIIAIGQDPIAAEMIGIRLLPNQMLSLAISAGFAGLSGGLLAHYITFIQPAIFNMDLSSLITAGVVCGGMGSLTGPFVAVALFIVIPELFRGLALWRLVLYGALLVVIINFRPKGLFGYEEINLNNAPKLFAISGVTIGLTLAASIYNMFVKTWGTIPAILAAVVAAVAVSAAISYLGKWLSNALKPGSAKLGNTLGRFYDRYVQTFEKSFTPTKRIQAQVQALKERLEVVKLDPNQPVIKIDHLTKRFGGVVAVNDLSFEVRPGEILGLIGPNGSGKTTVFNLISGVYPIDGGDILFDKKNMVGKSPTAIVLSGISRTFQNIRLFGSMTVLENVQTALHTACNYSLFEAFIRWPWSVNPMEENQRQQAYELLKLVDLEDYADRVAKTLPYGLQRKLEIARALALNPRLLLLDEPAAGMNPKESLELVDLINRIHKLRNLTIVLIEHHMDVVMNICQRIVVINFGSKIAEGSPDEIQNNPAVLEAYLGDKVEVEAYAPAS